MHRLKKWFGMKDWDGPTRDAQAAQEPDSDLAVSKSYSTTTVASVNMKSPASAANMTDTHPNTTDFDRHKMINPVFGHDSQSNLPLSTRAELWLRQYVPLQPDECLSCKLISTSVILIFMMYGVRATHRLKKFVQPRSRKWYYVGVLSSYGLAANVIYQRWFNTGLFQPVVEGEDKKERIQRILEEDVEYYKNMYEKIRGQPVSDNLGDNSKK